MAEMIRKNGRKRNLDLIRNFSNLIAVPVDSEFTHHPSILPAHLSAVYRAYAKINLGLYVLHKREDAYHEIRTVFHRIQLHDEIRFGSSRTVEVLSSSPEAPGDTSNLCFTAAQAIQEATGFRGGVRISLTKTIPVGAGLGGGSSDAATVLRALPDFWGAKMDGDALRQIALRLGSDVPYFLEEGSAVAGGRGEKLEYFPLDLPYSILLCYPGIHVSTAWAYGQVHPSEDHPPDLRTLLERGARSPLHLRQELRNDFEAPVFRQYPVVGRIKASMIAGGAVYASLSGSGSAVYGLYSEARRAAASAVELQAEGYATWITPPHFHPPT
jgi:4-diphosphocytidyl-2-C-methyl-D-erythritol kinase